MTKVREKTNTEVYTDYGFLGREYAYGVLVLSLSSTRYLKISKQG
jgi:hypothetical protein